MRYVEQIVKAYLYILIAGVVINEYFENCIWGARRFILKETDDTLPAAKRHMKV